MSVSEKPHRDGCASCGHIRDGERIVGRRILVGREAKAD